MAVDANDTVTSHDNERRLAMFGLLPEEGAELGEAREIIIRNIDQLTDAFYSHMLSFGELARFVSAAGVERRLRESFRAYLLNIGLECHETSYFESRLRIGSVHEKIGVPLKGYLGTYAKLQDLITQLILDKCGDDARGRKIVSAINKVIILDASLAIDAYHQAALKRIEQLMDQLEEEKSEIRHLAQTDQLTGLLNRRYFFDCLEAETQRCRRYGNPLCVLVIDLDDFKSINDEFGHHVGDAVLQSVSRTLLRSARKTDVCGRLGGEEFVAALVETDLETAALIAERFRLAVLHDEITVEDTCRVTVSVSIGVARWNPSDLGGASLLKRADMAMYTAKAEGKNCIHFAEEE